MGAKFWFRILNTTNKKEVDRQWKVIVKKEFLRAVKNKLKEIFNSQKEDYGDIKSTDSKSIDRKAPKEHAKYFPKFYIKKGKDGNFYIIKENKNKQKKWVKMNYRDYLDIVIYEEIPSSFGNGKGSYIFKDDKIFGTIEAAKKYIYENHNKWMSAIAVQTKNKTVIGGWVAY
jgi:hypothetical protein